MRSDFWRGRSVLVTGNTGFKGSWLSLWLQRAGADVAGIALEPPTRPALFELAAVSDGMAWIRGDIRDGDGVRRVVREHQPEVVFHLAGQPLVHESYRDPVNTFETNVMGTVNLLEAVRHTESVRAVVCVTSDKCYENKEWTWGYREDDTLGGDDPYSGSKACSELVTKAYRQSFLNGAAAAREISAATARAGNVIGGGDWSNDRLVPDAVRALSAGQPIVVRNPHAIRPWQHVLDPLNGYLTLAEHLYESGDSFAESWNFGPPATSCRRAGWVVDQLLSLWQPNAGWQHDERWQPHEAVHLMLDSSKAQIRLQWQPQLDLRVALEWVVEWHREMLGGADMRNVCERQIARFESLHGRSVDRASGGDAPVARTAGTSTIDAQLQLLDLAPDPMIVRRIDGTIIYWNRRAKEFYGWQKKEALGSVSHVLLRTEFRSPLAEIERELLSTGQWQGALVHTTREGRQVNVSSYWAVQKVDGPANAVLEVNRVALR